jgi:hypothetical protein
MICEECTEREYAERHPFRYLIRGCLPRRENPFTGMSGLYSASLGFNLYDRHRAEYVRTGDERELTRMLAHID